MPIDLTQSSYKRFRDITTERTRQIILFVGAGLSMPAGLPNWSGLRGKLEVALDHKAQVFSGDEGRRLNNALQSIKHGKDLWVAFDRLRKELGEPAFTAEVREALKRSDTAKIPSLYKELWQLPIRGIVSLNLDRFAARSYEPEGGLPPEPFQHLGFRSATATANPFKQPKPFIVQLHGSLDHHETWVLTHSDLSEIAEKSAYTSFIDTCFNAFTILFLGITADDIAVGGHLERLKQAHIDTGSHFWATNRKDYKTDRWASDHNIELIVYEPGDNDHPEIQTLVRDLNRFVPKDETVNPVKPDVAPRNDLVLPSEAELRTQSPDAVRQLLNNRAAQLLDSQNREGLKQYETFCKDYQEAIHKSWFVTDEPPFNELLGYTIEGRVETGGFGTVYRARDKATGVLSAIKILRPEVFSKKDMLQSFRRGVRSMRILTNRGIEGVVKCRGAFEIPTAVIMDWVEGPDLETAVRSGHITSWADIISISKQLSQIIRNGHVLPERVLHRDLRPKNIMLADYYEDPQNIKLVVLDFDLSWHQGALEQSVTVGRSYSGYLAPEQIQATTGVSTRSAGVDAFGLGMTLFFILVGHDPLPSNHLAKNWEEALSYGALRRPCDIWKSLPARFSRIIMNCTKNNQNERWDFSQIVAELERLQDVLDGRDLAQYGDILAEELITQVIEGNAEKYSVQLNTLAVESRFVSGVRLKISPNDKNRTLDLDVTWNDTGANERRNVGKYIIERLPGAKQQLISGGWDVHSSNYGAGALAISASLNYSDASKAIGAAAATLKGAVDRIALH